MTGFDTEHRILVQWIFKQITQRLKLIAGSGLSPRSMVLTVCIGGAMGLLPLIWGTSLLCLWLGQRFRLNHLVLQSINYLLYPVQLALLVPFCKLGTLLILWGPSIAPDQLLTVHHAGVFSALSLLLWLSFKALLAWLITVPPVALLVYLLLTRMVKRLESGSAVVAGL